MIGNNDERSWCSHIPVLVKALSVSEGPVLELGAGLFSTPLLYWLCFDQDREFVSYEGNKEYADNLVKFGVQYANDWDLTPIERPWGVVFIDHAPPERRHIDVARVAQYADYVVIHDSQKHLEQYFHYSKIYSLFKYKYVYRKTKPHTTVLSRTKEFRYDS